MKPSPISPNYPMINSKTALIGIQAASKILNIPLPEVYFNPYTDFSNPNVSSMYLKSRNAIVFNEKWLESVNELEILTTCFHESRHAYQHFCIQSNSREDQETINTWKRDFDGYSKPTNTNNPKNDESYLAQAIEIDAIAFAYHQMKGLFDVEVKIPDEIRPQVQKRIIELRGM